MDVILYQAGKRQLLRRREDLHAAHRLQRLPHLQTHNNTLQSHRRPAANSDLKSPGLPLDAACDASLSGFRQIRFVRDSLFNALQVILPRRLLVLAICHVYCICHVRTIDRVVLCTILERRQYTAGGASKDTIRDEL